MNNNIVNNNINNNINKVNIISLKGIRKNNEDRHTVIMNLDKSNKDQAPINLFGVYDGHGGKFVSSFLEESLPILFTDKRLEYPLTKDYINKVYKYLQEKILKIKYFEKAKQCGSTCLLGIHYKRDSNDYITIINTGDTRSVLCRDNFAIPLSKDHKPMWPEEKSRIEKLGGKITFDGEDHRILDLSVSRAFGDFDAEPYLTNMPDIFKYKLEKNDKFIVFACDGLWDVLDNQSVVNFILLECYDETYTKRINKHINVARRLGEYALQRGSTDNLTIIVYFLD